VVAPRRNIPALTVASLLRIRSPSVKPTSRAAVGGARPATGNATLVLVPPASRTASRAPATQAWRLRNMCPGNRPMNAHPPQTPRGRNGRRRSGSGAADDSQAFRQRAESNTDPRHIPPYCAHITKSPRKCLLSHGRCQDKEHHAAQRSPRVRVLSRVRVRPRQRPGPRARHEDPAGGRARPPLSTRINREGNSGSNFFLLGAAGVSSAGGPVRPSPGWPSPPPGEKQEGESHGSAHGQGTHPV
jgi:hypothetical protein